jgi:uncharacterized protein YhaN
MGVFARLDLIAYGNLEHVCLDFTSSPIALHLVLGDNEAGKSTIQRATVALPYGIPERTSDEHRHGYAQLRLGALLDEGQGNQLYVVRAKKRTGSLRSGDGEPLDESVLDPYFGGIGRDAFETMFSISWNSLERGGKELLAAKGLAGQTLFMAGTGLVGLHAVLDETSDVAGQLYKPNARASTVVAKALMSAQRAYDVIRASRLRPQEFDQREARLAELMERSASIRGELAAVMARKSDCDRRLRVVPLLARREALHADLDALGSLPRLDEDATAQREIAVRQRDDANRRLERARRTLDERHVDLEGVDVPETLLGHAEQIKAVHSGIGQYVSEGGDLERRRPELTVTEGDVGRRLRDLRPELEISRIEDLRLGTAARSSVQETIDRYPEAAGRLRAAENDVEQIESTLTAQQDTLGALPETPPSEGLRTALRLAGDLASAEEQLVVLDRRLKLRRKALDARLAELRPAVADLDTLRRLAVPAPAAVERSVERTRQLEEDARELERHRRQLEQDRVALRGEREELRVGGQAPSLDLIEQARRRRDDGWTLVVDRLHGEPDADAEEAYGEGRQLTEAYERAVHESDDLADRRASAAGQVAQERTLSGREARREELSEALNTAVESHQSEVRDGARAWRELWKETNIPLLSAPEMQAFIAGRRDVLERLGELESEEDRCVALDERIGDGTRPIRVALEKLGAQTRASSAAELQLVGHDKLGELEEQDQQRREVERAVAELLRKHEIAKSTLERAKQSADELSRDLAARLPALGASEPVTAVEASALLRAHDELFAAVDECSKLKRRIDGMEEGRKRFERVVSGLIDVVASDLSPSDPVASATALQARLENAQQARSRRSELERQAEDLELEVDEVEGLAEAAETTLHRLLTAAGCTTVEQLAGMEEKVARAAAIDHELTTVDTEITEIGTKPVADQIAINAGITAEALDADVAELDAELRDLGERYDATQREIGAARSAVDELDASDQAAAAADMRERALAEARRAAERHVVARIAALALDRAIERYRKANEGPLLTRANELFPRFTEHATPEEQFVELELEYRDGALVLVGRRKNGQQVPVEGMSEGTREQLYLALRLAAIDHYVATHGPMPVILDDVVLHSDPKRTRGILAVLGELSARTQIVLFTHREELAAAAQQTIADGGLYVHKLEAAGATVLDIAPSPESPARRAA